MLLITPPMMWCSTDCSGVCMCDWQWWDHACGRSSCCSSRKGQGCCRSSAPFLFWAGQVQVSWGESNPFDQGWSAWTQGLSEVSHHNQAGTSIKFRPTILYSTFPTLLCYGLSKNSHNFYLLHYCYCFVLFFVVCCIGLIGNNRGTWYM